MRLGSRSSIGRHTMNVRRVRFWLWTIGASMLAAAAGGFARLVTMPLAQPGSFAASTAGPSTRRASEESSVPTLRSFQPHWSLDLRRPLYDPPPAVKAEAPKPPPPPLAVKLAGTVIEPGYSRALLTVADGKRS